VPHNTEVSCASNECFNACMFVHIHMSPRVPARTVQVFIHVCTFAAHTYIYVCMYVCKCATAQVYLSILLALSLLGIGVCVGTRVCLLCECVCVCVCFYNCVYSDKSSFHME